MPSTALATAETVGEEFSSEFQKQILALMYADPIFLRMVSDTIKPEHFNDKIDATYAEIMIGFMKKFPKDRITKEVVFNEIAKLVRAKKIEDDDREHYVHTFAKIATAPPAPEYVRAEIKRFCMAKALEVELVGSVDLLRKGKYKEIVDRITKTYGSIEGAEETKDIKVISSIPDRVAILKDPEAHLIRDGISTGFPGLDALMYRHGVGKGEMLVVCGSPGRGKSIWLANMAMAAILAGHDVLYYTLEMASDIVMSRIDSMTTGIPFVDLIRHADMVAERWRILQSTFKMGEMYLHDLPPRYLTPNMIRRHLRQYADKGIFPSVLVVDYADIMASDRNITERRLEHGDVYEQLRGIGKESQIDVLTASQANRDSLRKKSVDLDSMAEDFSKAMTADYVIGLGQTKSEESYTESGRGTGLMRALLAKNRNGQKGVEVEFLTDFTRMRVSMRDMDRFDMDHFSRPVAPGLTLI